MSGGSYDYLCFKDSDEILAYERQMEEMSQRLAGLGYAEDAARETEETLLLLRQFRVRIQTRINRLRNVWKSVEWWDSCDSDEGGLKAALEEYRK